MIPGLTVNYRTRCLVRGDRRLSLRGPYIFRLLSGLAAAPGGLTRDELIDHVWGDRADGGPNDAPKQLHLYVHRYRRPLEHLGLVVLPRKGRPWELRDTWAPAVRVAHLQAAADQAAALAARATSAHHRFAGQVARELARISA